MLYPAPVRDFLIELATKGLYRAKWTNTIHDEWIESLLKKRPDLTRERLMRTRELMDRAVPDCLVPDVFEKLIPSVSLPDKNDRHVLAAAIHARCDAIITYNVRHFPEHCLSGHAIEVQHPDDFIHHQFGFDDVAVIMTATNCFKRLRKPPVSVDRYFEGLRRASLVKTVAVLEKYAAVIALADG